MSNIPDSITKNVVVLSLPLDSKFTLQVVVELKIFLIDSNALYRIELVCEEDGVKDIEVLETNKLEFLSIDNVKEHFRLFKKILEKSVPK